MKERNSILWQCTSRGSVLLRLLTDSSCEDRIHSCFHTQWREISICFHLTSVSDCGVHFLRPYTQSSGFWRFSFWIQRWQTPGFRAPQIFSLCEIPPLVWSFWYIFWVKILSGSVGVCSQSLRTWVCSEALFHETFPDMLGRGKGINHNSKIWLPQSLGYLGFILSDL